MPQLFMSPDGFPKEGQPLFWSTRPHPPNRARVPRRLSVPLGEDRRRRNKKVPPSASKFRRLSRSARLRRTEREQGGKRERSLRPSPSHGRWTPKNFHFAFMQLSQSVRLFGYCSPALSVRARRRSLMRQLCPILQSCIGREAAPTPFPFANAGTIRELMGQLCLARSLARSIPFASRMASAQYVRSHPIPSDLQLRFGRAASPSLSPSLGI